MTMCPEVSINEPEKGNPEQQQANAKTENQNANEPATTVPNARRKNRLISYQSSEGGGVGGSGTARGSTVSSVFLPQSGVVGNNSTGGGGGGGPGISLTQAQNNPSANNITAGGSSLAAGITSGNQLGVVAATVGPNPHHRSRRFDEDVKFSLIKVAVLGAAGVGKTSLIKRFVSNEFPRKHIPSTDKTEHFPSLILGDSLFELKVIDLPPIGHFPVNSADEWEDFRYYGLRAASAYLLVYDSSTPAATFRYIRNLREQMLNSREMSNIPIIVAANKTDLVTSNNQTSSSSSKNQQIHAHQKGCEMKSTNPQYCGFCNRQDAKDRKDIAALVKKTWRSAHVECSAKYNWNVTEVFRELAVTLDMIAHGQMIGPGSQSVGKKKRCLIF